MAILISGTTGFLGSHILKRLLSDEKNDIVILKRSFSNIGRISDLMGKIRSYDIDKVSLKDVFSKNEINMVIHTATNYGRKQGTILKTVDANLMFPLELLETATQVGVGSFINVDTLLDRWINSYALSKKQFVDWLKYFSKHEKIKVINLRLDHMYGPDDDDNKFVIWFIRKLLNNVDKIALTEGKQKRDFTYIDDVVDAIVKILDAKDTFSDFEEFDVGSRKQIELRGFIELVLKEMRRESDNQTILDFGAIPYRDGEHMEINESIDKLKNLGWKSSISLKEGIKRTIDFEREKLKC